MWVERGNESEKGKSTYGGVVKEQEGMGRRGKKEGGRMDGVGQAEEEWV